MTVRIGEFEQLVLLALLGLKDCGDGPALQITLGCAGRQVSLGTICKTLHRLENKGLVTGRWGRPRQEPGGRRKRGYRVASQGLEALRAALAALHKLYGRTPEHEFVGAVSPSRSLPLRFRHMSDNVTHMPLAKSDLKRSLPVSQRLTPREDPDPGGRDRNPEHNENYPSSIRLLDSPAGVSR